VSAHILVGRTVTSEPGIGRTLPWRGRWIGDDGRVPAALPLTLDDVWAAAGRLDGVITRTPCSPSSTLSAITGVDVSVKFENLQFTASFKERGARNRLELLDADERRAGVIAASAGNHAQGLARHAALLGVPATIVMPAQTPLTKVSRTKVLGARVELVGERFEDAAAHARHLAETTGATIVHPFDDPVVMAGQGTVALEMLADRPEIDTLIVPIGGGGLASGMAVAARGVRPDVRVVGVQVAGYAWASRHQADRETVASAPTVAEGIAVKVPGVVSAPIIDALLDDVVVVSEEAVERAVGLYLEIEKVVAEGAGAASLAAVLEHPGLFAGRRCGLVLSGGNVDLRLLATMALRSLATTHRLAVLRILVDDRPGALAGVVQSIAASGGNIVEVRHVRHRAGLPSRRAELEVEVETASEDELRALVDALHAAGLEVQVQV
jgi:threonine dehydratase